MKQELNKEHEFVNNPHQGILINQKTLPSSRLTPSELPPDESRRTETPARIESHKPKKKVVRRSTPELFAKGSLQTGGIRESCHGIVKGQHGRGVICHVDNGRRKSRSLSRDSLF